MSREKHIREALEVVNSVDNGLSEYGWRVVEGLFGAIYDDGKRDGIEETKSALNVAMQQTPHTHESRRARP